MFVVPLGCMYFDQWKWLSNYEISLFRTTVKKFISLDLDFKQSHQIELDEAGDSVQTIECFVKGKCKFQNWGDAWTLAN